MRGDPLEGVPIQPNGSKKSDEDGQLLSKRSKTDLFKERDRRGSTGRDSIQPDGSNKSDGDSNLSS
jgi:hypothetical protein